MLKAADWNFIGRIDARFPGLRENFQKFCAAPPEDRRRMAHAALEVLRRRGWVVRGVPEAEAQTVAAHTRAVARLAYDYTPSSHSRDTCVVISYVHDMAEAITGDFIPHDDIANGEKRRLEALALDIIFESHPDFIHFWRQYEQGLTPEGKFVKDLDKLEMFLKAKEYAVKYPAVDLSEFFVYCRQRTWETKAAERLYDAWSKMPAYAPILSGPG